jgi:hypothetical protein
LLGSTKLPDGYKIKVIKLLDSIKEKKRDDDNNGSDPSSNQENSGSKSNDDIKDVGGQFHYLNEFDFTE